MADKEKIDLTPGKTWDQLRDEEPKREPMNIAADLIDLEIKGKLDKEETPEGPVFREVK